MPKLFLPPQGGEKWLCIFTFLFMMFSIVCCVIMIYCIVIIYIPSMNEGETNYVGPKRCTTTLIERNVTNAFITDTKCNWSSCGEWCLSSKGTSPCSKMYGILRDPGAEVTFDECELRPENGFIDHVCTTAEDLEPINCKRSKYETSDPGRRETCVGYNSLISCEAGHCKNISKIWDCTYKDRLLVLLDDYGSKSQLEGWCNCRRCAESNTSIVDGDKLTCPKDTEYCFLSTANPATYDEKMQELCKEPGCETCLDICRDRRQCLDMKSRRDVVYFGVDEYDDPLLTYYQCQDGNCTEIYDMKCNRTCDDVKFNLQKVNVALLQGERVVMASCKRSLLNGTELLPRNAVGNNNWNKLVAACSNITINQETNSIMATDCINGTWFENLNTVDYNTLTKTYEAYRSNTNRWVKRASDDGGNLVPYQEDLVIFNDTRILKNQEGCVNTLSMECMDFYHRYGRDGSNYTARAVFDCYYNPDDDRNVVIDYQPERTLFYLMFWSLIPGAIMFISCVYMCVCSKFMFIGDDGHMRIFCCGKAVTGIGDVAVYKAPSKNKT